MKKKLGYFLIICLAMISSSTGKNDNYGFPFDDISDDSLLTLVESRTFQYFGDGAEPVSGMARERYHTDGVYPDNDMNVVTSGGRGRSSGRIILTSLLIRGTLRTGTPITGSRIRTILSSTGSGALRILSFSKVTALIAGGLRQAIQLTRDRSGY